MEIEKGKQYRVRAHTSEPGKGLTYPAGIYTLLDDGCDTGWDVYDASGPIGNETAVYGFSVLEKVESIHAYFKRIRHARYHVIAPDDIGRLIAEDMGIVQATDIGKRVIPQNDRDFVQMESEDQRDFRQRESIRCNIVRFYANASIRRRVIQYNVSLNEAQKHCKDPSSSSRTCHTGPGAARTRRIGAWFDGYEQIGK